MGHIIYGIGDLRLIIYAKGNERTILKGKESCRNDGPHGRFKAIGRCVKRIPNG